MKIQTYKVVECNKKEKNIDKKEKSRDFSQKQTESVECVCMLKERT